MDSLDARRPFVTSAFSESAPAVSPSGRLLAYASDETGTDQIYLINMPMAGARVPVSVGGGTEPAWSRDGSRLYFRGPARMMVATITERPTPAVARIDSLFVDRYFRERWNRQYDVLRDGRLLMVGVSGREEAASASLFAIVNWQAMLGASRPERGER